MRSRDHRVDDALELVAEIHAQVARGAFYRGYRAAPVAAMGGLALLAAIVQSFATPEHAQAFAAQWIGVAIVSCVIVSLDLAARWKDIRGRDTSRALGQILPALAVGLALTFVLWERAEVLPGVWSMVFGLGVLASSPFLPRAILGVALFYVIAGAAMAFGAEPGTVPSPWGMGLTFGAGQLVTAAALHHGEDPS